MRHHPDFIPDGARYVVLEDGRTAYMLIDVARALNILRHKKGYARAIRHLPSAEKARISFEDYCEAFGVDEVVAGHSPKGQFVLLVTAEGVNRLMSGRGAFEEGRAGEAHIAQAA